MTILHASGEEGLIIILHTHHVCHLRDVGREVMSRVGLATLGGVLHRVGSVMLATRRCLHHPCKRLGYVY